MTESDADKFMEATFNNLEKLGDPGLTSAMSQYPSMFKDIETNTKDLPQTVNAFAQAMKDGELSTDDLNKVLVTYGREMGLAVKPTSELTEEQQKIADNNILTRTINQVTTNINLQARAVRGATKDWGNYQNIMSGGGVLPEIPDGAGPGGSGQNPLDPSRYNQLLISQTGGENKFKEWEVMVRVIESAAQKSQTASANLANEGTNSMAMLAKNSSIAANGINKNFNVAYSAAGHLQTGIANLANEGSSSLSALAKASSKNASGIRKNLNVGYSAAGHLQTGLANLATKAPAH